MYVYKTYDGQHSKTGDMVSIMEFLLYTYHDQNVTMRPWRWVGTEGDIPGCEKALVSVEVASATTGLIAIA